MIPGIAAKKGAEAATKPLTGDIYVRRWQTKVKKGKHKGEVRDHEIRVNALTGAIAAVGVGLTAVAGGVALWMSQQKLTKTTNKMLIRRVRVYEPVYKTVTVIDTPAQAAWDETITKDTWVWSTRPVYELDFDWLMQTGQRRMILVSEGSGYYAPQDTVYHHDAVAAVTHDEQQLVQAARTVIMTARGVPIKTYAGVRVMPVDILGPAQVDYWGFNKMLQDRTDKEDRTGKYAEWVTQYISTTGKKNLGLSDREGFKVGL